MSEPWVSVDEVPRHLLPLLVVRRLDCVLEPGKAKGRPAVIRVPATLERLVALVRVTP